MLAEPVARGGNEKHQLALPVVWNGGTVSPTPKPTPTPTQDMTSCPCDQGDTLNCSDFDFWWKARSCYERSVELGYGDVHGLDENDDGTICTGLLESEPLEVNSRVCFHSWEGQPLEGWVLGSEYRDILTADGGDSYHPEGVFLVAILAVEHGGSEPVEVGGDNLRVRDDQGRTFNQVGIFVQMAAEDEYGYEGRYDPIQPGYTKHLVFVFDVLRTSQGLYLVGDIPC